jgi:tetratricopeptide (TPR) repeat protein
MAKKKKKDSAAESIQTVEQALSKTEVFIERNQNIIVYSFIAIMVIVGVFYGYRKYVKLPKERRAQEEMFFAERYYEKDSLDLALMGDGNNLGFLDIIDEYKRTSSGNLARFYAGTIYLKKGEFENAIDMLEGFKGKDDIVGPIGTGRLADAYLEVGEVEKAATKYVEAAEERDNPLTTPMFLFRAGITYEKLLDNPKKALELYDRIRIDFPKSNEARSIEKYIARAELAAGTDE